MKTIKALGKYIGDIKFINGTGCDKPYDHGVITYGLDDSKKLVDSLIEDRDIHVQQAKKRSDAQAKDNAALINKITILNGDIKDYEKATKLIIAENHTIIKNKRKDYLDYVECVKQKNTYRSLTTMLIILVLGFMSVALYLGVAAKQAEYRYYDQYELLKDSIHAEYVDTIWICRNVISKGVNDAIASQRRFEYTIDYFASSPSKRVEMYQASI